VLTVGRRFDWEGEADKVSVSIYVAERYAAARGPRVTILACCLTTVSSTTTLAVAWNRGVRGCRMTGSGFTTRATRCC